MNTHFAHPSEVFHRQAGPKMIISIYLVSFIISKTGLRIYLASAAETKFGGEKRGPTTYPALSSRTPRFIRRVLWL